MIKQLTEEAHQLQEGTWAFTKDLSHYDRFIKQIEALKKQYYSYIGDDEVFDGLDNAITRIKQLKEEAKKEASKKK